MVKQSRNLIVSPGTDCEHRFEALEAAWYRIYHIEKAVLICRWWVREGTWSANPPLIWVPDHGLAKKAGMSLRKTGERPVERHRERMVESLEENRVGVWVVEVRVRAAMVSLVWIMGANCWRR